MVSGMAMPSRRQVSAQVTQASGLSSFRPAPISAMMHHELGQPLGDRQMLLRMGSDAGHGGQREDERHPRPTQTMGRESGSSFSTMGSQAVSSTTAPKPASTTI